MKIEGTYGRGFERVRVDGKRLSPARSLRVFNHSPTGFAWGYGGSGPAQLALAILLRAGLTPARAVRLHQRFKWEFIAPLPQLDDWALDVDVLAWASAHPEPDD